MDLSTLHIVDCGDISAGFTFEEALGKLTLHVSDMLRRGAIPIVLGGTSDIFYHNAASLMSVAGGNIAVVTIDSRLNVRSMVSSIRFCCSYDDSTVIFIRQASEGGRSLLGASTRALLEDIRFCPPRDGLDSRCSCDNRFVVFGAQVRSLHISLAHLGVNVIT